MGSTGSVTTHLDAGVATLTLANPDRKNAITLQMAEMIHAFCEMVHTDETIGAVVVRGEGNYFCSGADTRDLASFSVNPADPESVRRTSAIYHSFVDVGELPVPTLSVVIGGAVGAGVNLALATDLMLIADDATFDSGFLARRIHPGGGHLGLLGRAGGRPAAFGLGVFGIPISGSEAAARGLAWASAPAAELGPLADQMTKRAAADPVLARRIKQSAQLEIGPPAAAWPAALEIERGMQMWSFARKGAAGWADTPRRQTPPSS